MSVESPPFARGQTFYNGNTIDSGDYGGVPYEGRTFIWETDSSISTTVLNAETQRRTSNRARTIIVRNVSTVALAPGRIVTWQTGQWGKRVDGYSAVPPGAGTTISTSAIAGVVDDRINGTVAVGDLFHLVVAGPCNVVQAASNLAADVAQGDVITAITATSTNTNNNPRANRIGNGGILSSAQPRCLAMTR